MDYFIVLSNSNDLEIALRNLAVSTQVKLDQGYFPAGGVSVSWDSGAGQWRVVQAVVKNLALGS